MKTFVISMETPTGKERLEAMSKRCAVLDLEYEVVRGIDGKALSDTDITNNTSALCSTFCTPGTIGAALSHMECWKRVLREGDSALILEDDAVLAPNFKQTMQEALRHVPHDYHILLLGCFSCSPLVQTVAFGGGDGTKEDSAVRSIRFFGGAHAYVVSKAGARHLLEACADKVAYHIDIQMSLTPGIKIYAVKHDVAVQEDMSTSSIATFGFPFAINSAFHHVKDSKNISLAYYSNAAVLRMGPYDNHLVMTSWHVSFLCLGFFLKSQWLQWVMCLLLTDIAVAATRKDQDVDALDVAGKLAFFGAGILLRKRYWR